ncbi:MAG: class II aldolase/adducin family protein [Mogibacterium sp.]|nr:class II aldolase/adducin family protein [Mogibacterium sp.]
MDYDKGVLLLENAVKGFHGKFKKMYGQMAVRLDDSSYLATGGTKILAEIKTNEFELCDINSGDFGEIFKARKDINAIIFGCSSDTASASADVSSIPASLEDLAMLTGPELKVISDTSSEALIQAVSDTNVCLIKGIGAIAACSNLKKAVAGIQIVEKACEAENHGKLIGGAIALDTETALSCRNSFENDYTNRNEESHVNFIGFDEDEFALRSQLIEFGKDLVRHDLSYGSWGNLSVRLNENEMLITPSSMDYFEIKPEDIVRVNLHTLEYGDQRIPSSEAPMHAAIYRKRSDADSIIHTHSNAISVFAACEKGFAIEDSALKGLIGDILITEYAPAGSDRLAEVVCAAMENTHACIIPHHGAVFYGPSLDVVFAIAEAVEQKARNLLLYDT